MLVIVFQNKSYLGCFYNSRPANQPNLQNELFSVELSASECINACNTIQHSVAVLNKGLQTCTCYKSLSASLKLVRNEIQAENCSDLAFVTDFATSFCKFSSFINPFKEIVPRVGLISVPGSGNTWTRYMKQ